MIIKTRLALLLTLLPFISFAQVYEQVTWLGYTKDLFTDVYEIDNAGNAYVKMEHYNPEWSSFLFPNGDADGNMVIAKLDPKGNLIWSKPIVAQIYYIKTDAQQNVYISGVGNNIKLDDGKTLPSGPFLLKLDKIGKALWGVVVEEFYGNHTSGPIAIADEGVYWNTSFYGRIKLQDRILNAKTDSPDSFVAKIDNSGRITALYHDNSRSIVQDMVEAENGNAAVIISRGGLSKAKLILDKNCKLLSDKPFLNYGDFPSRVNYTSQGYEMLTRIGIVNNTGYVEKGFYHVTLDKNMDLIDSVKLFEPYQPMDPDAGGKYIWAGVGNKEHGFYLESTPQPYLNTQHNDWLRMNQDYNLKQLPDENDDVTIGDDPISRRYVKMVGDTLHMMIRRFSYYYGNSFTLNNKTYTTPSPDNFSWFWVKYVYKDPDSCRKIKVKVLENGIEGSKNAIIRFELPKSCPAVDKLSIIISEKDPLQNQGDFVLPDTATILPGSLFVDLVIPITNDEIMEEKESFELMLNVTTYNGDYELSVPDLVFTIEDDDDIESININAPSLIDEGEINYLTIGISNGKVAPVDIALNLVLTKETFGADKDVDYKLMPFVLPANTNNVKIKLEALEDDLIEGDEYINGTLSLDPSIKKFKLEVDKIVIQILDPDNSFENRVFYIDPSIDSLKEGTQQTYSFSLKSPLKLQRSISISATPTISLPPYVTQSTSKMEYGYSDTELTVYNLEDFVIGMEPSASFSLSASDTHTGDYRFVWNERFTDRMRIHLIDNDEIEATPIDENGVVTELSAPNAFSPNGDGVNDKWMIESLISDPNCKVNITNRYGILVYSSTGYNNPWDGKVNGADAAVGIYFYKIISGRNSFTGTLTLLR